MAPDTPADFPGTEAEFLTANMGMDAEQVRAMLGQATTVAAGEGLEYDFDNVKHSNTNLAHQLLHFAKTQGKQPRSEEHTSELQSRGHLVCRLLLEKKKQNTC